MRDLAAEMYIEKDNRTDTSYKETETGIIGMLLGFKKYTLNEMRDAWLSGKKCGFEMGIDYGSPQGRILQLTTNITDTNEKEFYDNFIKLCQKHNIRISYHPHKGMCFENLNRQ